MLAAPPVKPALRRRLASSRPRRWGIETIRGADILDTLADLRRTSSNRRRIWRSMPKQDRKECPGPRQIALTSTRDPLDFPLHHRRRADMTPARKAIASAPKGASRVNRAS